MRGCGSKSRERLRLCHWRRSRPASVAPGFICVSLQRLVDGEETVRGAVLLPAVVDYPKDKIEVVAQVRIKDALSVKDGDRLVLEFDD